MLPAKVLGENVVDGHIFIGAAAILAMPVVSAEDFGPGKGDPWPRAGDQVVQPDDRRNRIRGGGGFYQSPPI